MRYTTNSLAASPIPVGAARFAPPEACVFLQRRHPSRLAQSERRVRSGEDLSSFLVLRCLTLSSRAASRTSATRRMGLHFVTPASCRRLVRMPLTEGSPDALHHQLSCGFAYPRGCRTLRSPEACVFLQRPHPSRIAHQRDACRGISLRSWCCVVLRCHPEPPRAEARCESKDLPCV